MNEKLSKVFLIRYPATWHTEIEKIAEKNCETVSTVIRRAIKELVAREKEDGI